MNKDSFIYIYTYIAINSFSIILKGEMLKSTYNIKGEVLLKMVK